MDEVVHPRSAGAAEGMVFRTRHEGEAATVGRIEIGLQEGPPGETRVQVSYTFTALSSAGNAYVEGFTEERYAERMRRWEAALNEVLLGAADSQDRRE